MNEPRKRYDQRHQTVYGPQINIAGDITSYSSASAPIIPHILPQVDTMHFTGRTHELELMASRLFADSPASVLGIWGPAGIGKSAVTHYFAKTHAARFPDGIISLDAQDKSASTLAAEFAKLMGDPIDDEDEFTPNVIIQSRIAHRRCLLILDNVTRTDARMLVPNGKATLIVTTRDRELLDLLGIDDTAQIPVSYFTSSESSLFLTKLIGQPFILRELHATEDLIELVAGLPLALRIAGTNLRARSHRPQPIAHFVAQLHDEQNRLLTLQRRDVTELNLEAVFRLSLSMLNEAEHHLFACLSACIPQDFGLAAAAATVALDENTVANQLSRLVNLAMIDYDPDRNRYRFHALLYLFARSEALRLQLSVQAATYHAYYFVNYTRERQNFTAANLEALTLEQAAILHAATWMVENKNWDTQFWRGLNLLLSVRGYWQDAIELIKSYINLAIDLEQDTAVGYFYARLARYYRHLADYEESIAYYKRSYLLLKRYGDQGGMALVLNGLGWALLKKGNIEIAVISLKKSLTYLEEHDDRFGMAVVLNSLASALLQKGDVEAAIEHFQRSLVIEESRLNQRGVALVLNGLGGAILQKGDVEAAINHFQRSLALMQEHGDQRGIAIVLNGLARAILETGNVKMAIDHFQQSLTIIERCNDQAGIAMVLNGLGTALLRKRAFDTSVGYFQRSLSIVEECNDRRGIAMVLNSMGNAFLQKGEIEVAIGHFQRSLVIEEQLKNQHGMAMVLFSLARSYLQKGEVGSAIEYFQRSLAIEEKITNPRGMAMVLYGLGRAYQKKGDVERAIEHFQRSLIIDESTGNKRGMAIVRKKLNYLQNYKVSLTKVLATNQDEPMSATDHRRIGKEFMQKGNSRTALQHFLLALNLGIETSQLGGLHAHIGEAALQCVYYDMAIEHFQSAIIRGEVSSRVYGGLAWALHQLSAEPKMIEDHFLQALSLDTKRPWTYTQYSVFLKDVGRLEEAEAAARQAITLHSNHPIFLNNLGLILEKYGDQAHLRAAEACFMQAIAVAKATFTHPRENLNRVRARLAASNRKGSV